MSKKIILGVDTGFATCGWAVLSKDTHAALSIIDFGAIITYKEEEMHKRLMALYESIGHLIDEYKPKAMALESLFYFKNQKTVMTVSQARGVILLAAAIKSIPVYSYTPLQVKTAVTGYGRAEKKQIQLMVQKIFRLKEVPKPDDAADAIAIAFCHINN